MTSFHFQNISRCYVARDGFTGWCGKGRGEVHALASLPKWGVWREVQLFIKQRNIRDIMKYT